MKREEKRSAKPARPGNDRSDGNENELAPQDDDVQENGARAAGAAGIWDPSATAPGRASANRNVPCWWGSCCPAAPGSARTST